MELRETWSLNSWTRYINDALPLFFTIVLNSSYVAVYIEHVSQALDEKTSVTTIVIVILSLSVQIYSCIIIIFRIYDFIQVFELHELIFKKLDWEVLWYTLYIRTHLICFVLPSCF